MFGPHHALSTSTGLDFVVLNHFVNTYCICVRRYWKTKQLSPKRLSTGILMFTLASSLCDQIHLYGFWPFGWDPNTGKELPYHYYDKKGTKFTTKWQESHQLPTEFKLLFKMHTEGVLKLSLSHCA